MKLRALSAVGLVGLSLFAVACGGSDGGSTGGGEGATAGVGGSAGDAGSGGDAGSSASGATGGMGGSDVGGSGGDAGSGVGGAGSGGAGSGGSAGSAGNGGTAGAASGGTGGLEADVTPPSIVTTLPADAALGVLEDAKIVVTFSEPMDQAAAEQAYESVELPASEVTMAWNAAGDELTITPNSKLPYKDVAGPDVDQRFGFGFTITTTATDKAGNNLEADAHFGFSTARRVSQTLDRVASLTGLVSGTGYKATNDIIVGDGSANQEYRGFLTIDMAKLPDGILEFEKAGLHVNQDLVSGAPYVGHGSLEVHELDFVALDATAFSAGSLGNLGVLTKNSLLIQKNIDVVRTLAADYGKRSALGDRCQFRLQFTTGSDFDGATDNAHFEPTTLGMDVVYLAE